MVEICSRSDLLWVHCFLSVLYMVFAVWLMRFFASKIKATKDEDVNDVGQLFCQIRVISTFVINQISATLMIANIRLSKDPDRVRQTETDLFEYFKQVNIVH